MGLSEAGSSAIHLCWSKQKLLVRPLSQRRFWRRRMKHISKDIKKNKYYRIRYNTAKMKLADADISL